LSQDFAFNFIKGAPARFDTLFEALLYNSRPIIPRFHLIVNNFPAGSGSHVAKNTRKAKLSRISSLRRRSGHDCVLVFPYCPGRDGMQANARLRNPAFVGMGALIVALVGISGQIRLSDIVIVRSAATWQSSCWRSYEGRNPAFFVIRSATKNLFFITQPPKPDSKIKSYSFTVNEYNL
jgi:hypothetical protein